jgi:branched-chain amino acid transport system ATP-binding protein
MIELRGIDVAYGPLQVLWDVNLTVEAGEVLAILGANGAGKSTVMATMSGVVRPIGGSVLFEGEDVTALSPKERVQRGIVHVLERQRVFPFMSVYENLKMGAYLRGPRKDTKEGLERVYDLFPFLKERTKQRAGLMSGGEQQMLVIARGLMAQPRLMMLDEPFLGLSPYMVSEILTVIRTLNEDGITVAFIEQHVKKALDASHRAYVLEAGRVVLTGSSDELLSSGQVTKVYMGVETREAEMAG